MRLSSLVIPLVVSLAATSAHASDDSPTVPLTIESTTSTSVEIRSPTDQALKATCVAPCTLTLPVGPYLLGVAATRLTTAGTERIFVGGASVAKVEPGLRSERGWGLGFIIAGGTCIALPVAVLAGAGTDNRDLDDGMIALGILGAALSVTGWYWFVHANGPSVTIVPSSSATARRDRTTFDGATATLRLAF